LAPTWPRRVGIELGRNTIKRILLEHGIEPVPERSHQGLDNNLGCSFERRIAGPPEMLSGCAVPYEPRRSNSGT